MPVKVLDSHALIAYFRDEPGAEQQIIGQRGRRGFKFGGALRDLAALRAQAEKETQLNRRVEINLAIKKLDARIAELDASL